MVDKYEIEATLEKVEEAQTGTEKSPALRLIFKPIKDLYYRGNKVGFIRVVFPSKPSKKPQDVGYALGLFTYSYTEPEVFSEYPPDELGILTVEKFEEIIKEGRIHYLLLKDEETRFRVVSINNIEI